MYPTWGWVTLVSYLPSPQPAPPSFPRNPVLIGSSRNQNAPFVALGKEVPAWGYRKAKEGSLYRLRCSRTCGAPNPADLCASPKCQPDFPGRQKAARRMKKKTWCGRCLEPCTPTRAWCAPCWPLAASLGCNTLEKARKQLGTGHY